MLGWQKVFVSWKDNPEYYAKITAREIESIELAQHNVRTNMRQSTWKAHLDLFENELYEALHQIKFRL